MGLENFICLRKLGNGQFGNVYLIKEKNKSQLYAMKCISKASVVE